jgi:2-phosphosulfolactate phosphatase
MVLGMRKDWGRQAVDRVVRITSAIDELPQDGEGDAAVVVDVIRSTTTAITAVTTGRRCFPVATIDEAVERAKSIPEPLLVGELGGTMPYGFDVTNSPAAIAERLDTWRPMVLLSTSGTQLMRDPGRRGPVFVACLRNYSVMATHLLERHRTITLVGAMTRGEFREEDQLCCAWIAELLVAEGYRPTGQTSEIIDRWRGAPAEALTASKSCTYLRDTGQVRDLDFILGHVDDVDEVFRIRRGEVIRWSEDLSGRVPLEHLRRSVG